jgi:hypothetical protein
MFPSSDALSSCCECVDGSWGRWASSPLENSPLSLHSLSVYLRFCFLPLWSGAGRWNPRWKQQDESFPPKAKLGPTFEGKVRSRMTQTDFNQRGISQRELSKNSRFFKGRQCQFRSISGIRCHLGLWTQITTLFKAEQENSATCWFLLHIDR